ncbi:VOC family protein [Deinococcus sp.]|uniref:VOC family protein n=1 Tax=Deinococcus sp. TaxID=47478 RepID=UPI0025B88591|nr:VOC family protein [Deinococcus sp.]
MLKHVSFLTRDLNATVAFYETLGATTEKDLTTPEGYRRAVLRLGKGHLQFFQIPDLAPQPHAHWAEHIALHVTGLRALLTALRASGVPVTRDLQASPGGRDMAFVQDPDGRQVELLEG